MFIQKQNTQNSKLHHNNSLTSNSFILQYIAKSVSDPVTNEQEYSKPAH